MGFSYSEGQDRRSGIDESNSSVCKGTKFTSFIFQILPELYFDHPLSLQGEFNTVDEVVVTVNSFQQN